MIKKFIIIILAGALGIVDWLTLPMTHTTANAEDLGSGYYRGDVNGDGVVTAGDARLILRASCRLEDFSEDMTMFKRADVDGNNKVTAADARLCLRTSVQLEKEVYTPEPEKTQPIKEGIELIPQAVKTKVITSIETDFATIAVLSDNTLRYYKNGVETHCWDVDTTQEDILFDMRSYYRSGTDEGALDTYWYGVIGDAIFSFYKDYFTVVCYDVVLRDFSPSRFYCFYLGNSDTLCAWTPFFSVAIEEEVNYGFVYFGHLFYKCWNGRSYVLNADPYLIQEMSYEYINTHDISYGARSVYLGNGSLSWYAYELGTDENNPDEAKLAAFNAKYGVDISVWGNPN